MNPVLLVDHRNESGSVAGRVIDIEEDEVGLKFSARLMPIDKCHAPHVKHAVACAMEGILHGISIAGIFDRDTENKSVITRAHIYEISLVAIPADQHSLTKSMGGPEIPLVTWNEKKIRIALNLAIRNI